MDTKKPSAEDKTDLQLVMGLIGNSVLSDDGIQQVQQLMQQAKDPVGVLTQVVYHAVSQAHASLMQKNIKVSKNIWLARAGVVDQTVAEVVKLVSGVSGSKDLLNPNVLEQTRTQVASLLKQQEASAKGAPQEAPTEMQAPVPEQGMMPQEAPMQGLLAGG